MRKLFLFTMIFILCISLPSAIGISACLSSSNSEITSLLQDLGYDVVTPCTSGFTNHKIVVDVDNTNGVRASNVPVVLVPKTSDGIVSDEWNFETGGCCQGVSYSGTSVNTGSNPSEIDDNVAANPTIYSSSDTIYNSDSDTTSATPITDNDAYQRPAQSTEEAVWWWDSTDDDDSEVLYSQRGVFIGFHLTNLWTDSAKRIFNNSVNYVCPVDTCNNICIPPETGNWIINTTCTLTNEDHNITGNITIGQTGSLNLIGSGGYINFIGTNRFIFIFPGGNLTLDTSATIGKDPI